MSPNAYDETWGHLRSESRSRARPQDIDIEAIVAEARQMQAAESARIAGAVARGIARAWNTLIAGPMVRAYRRSRMERELSALNDQMLADIGVSRADIPRIAREAYRARRDQADPAPTTLYEVTRAARPDAPTKRAA